jgi:hypothetical protein
LDSVVEGAKEAAIGSHRRGTADEEHMMEKPVRAGGAAPDASPPALEEENAKLRATIEDQRLTLIAWDGVIESLKQKIIQLRQEEKWSNKDAAGTSSFVTGSDGSVASADGSFGSESTKAGVEAGGPLRALIARTLDALESDATAEDRQDVWNELRDHFFPLQWPVSSAAPVASAEEEK